MAINPLISLQARTPDIGQSFSNALLNVQKIDAIKQSREQAPVRQQLLETQAQSAQAQAPVRQRLLESQTQTSEAAVPTSLEDFNERQKQLVSSVAGAARQIAPDLQAGNIERVRVTLQNRFNNLQSQGLPTRETEEGLALLDTDPNELIRQSQNAIALDERLNPVTGTSLTSGQKEFRDLTKDLTKNQVSEAKLIKLGLSPRAVGSAIQTISDSGTADEIGKAEATIAQRKKFGEMTGSSRAKAIDKGFEKIVKIDLGISNLDRAIDAIDDGAGTGVLLSFSPSIKASSVALEQVQNTLALDVLNSATFGALSAEELKLVKQTALPIKLPPQELRQWVLDRKEAEIKLKSYFQEQINFLDQGGTVAGFLRLKEREQENTPPTTTEAPPENNAPQNGVTFLGFE